MKKFLLLCAVVVFGLTSQPILPTYAAIPRLINYQASVIDGPLPVNLTTAVTFDIYETEDGGPSLWTEVKSVTIENSLMDVVLGEDDAFVNLDFTKQYWLEVRIGENAPLPRTRLTAAPYAISAGSAETANVATKALLADNVLDNSIGLSSLKDEVKILGGDLVGNLPNPTIRPGAIIENIPNGSIGMDKLAADVTTLPAGPATGDLTGTYPAPLIRNFAVTEDKIANNAITPAKIDNGAVQNRSISSNAVSTDKIENLTIINEDISNFAAISGSKIVPNFGNQNIITTGSLTASNINTTSANTFTANEPSPNAVITITNTGAGHALNLNAGTDGNALLVNGNEVLNGNLTATGIITGNGSGLTNLNGTNITTGTVVDARIDANLTRDNESPNVAGDINGNYTAGLNIKNLAVTTAKIADGAVTGLKLENSGATAGTYGSATQVPVVSVDAKGRVTSVTNTAITGVNPAGATLNTGNVWVGDATNQATAVAVTGDLALSNTGVATINNSAVTTLKLADNSVATAKIIDGAVTGAKLENSGATAGTYGSATQVPVVNVDAKGRVTSVTNATITGVSPVGSTLTSSNILVGNALNQAASVAVTGDVSLANTGTVTINNSAVTASKIATDAITTTKIVDGAVTGAKLENSGATAGTYGSANQVPVVNVDSKGRVTSVTNTTITGVSPVGSTLASTNILLGNATNQATAVAVSGDLTLSNTGVATIANNAVTNIKINDGAVTTIKLADNAVSTIKIATDAVTEAKLDILNAPTDKFILSFDNVSGKMNWVEGVNTNTSGPIQGNGSLANPITMNTTGVSANEIWLRNSANTGWISSLISNDNVNNKTLTASKVDAGTSVNGAILTSDGVGNASWSNQLAIDISNKVDKTENPAAGDISGNFTAGLTINTNAVTTTKINDGAVTGVKLENSGVTAGTYGSANQVPVVNVDAKGRVTSVTNTTISGVSPVGSDLTSTNVWLGNGSNQAASVALSGDLGLSNTGVATITNNAVTTTKINDGAVTTTKINDGAVTTTKIATDAVTEAKLDILNAPADNNVLAYDQASGRMEWVTGVSTNTSGPIQGDGTLGDPITMNTTGVSANEIWVRNSANTGWTPSLISNDNVNENTLTASKVDAGTSVNGAVLTSDGLGIATWSNQLAIDVSNRVISNLPITAGTGTKVTYDSKGLVTSSTDATTADINSSLDRRYVTDSQLLVLSGLGTMAVQNANAVAITGGTITNANVNNTPIGALVASTGNFTTLSATAADSRLTVSTQEQNAVSITVNNPTGADAALYLETNSAGGSGALFNNIASTTLAEFATPTLGGIFTGGLDVTPLATEPAILINATGGTAITATGTVNVTGNTNITGTAAVTGNLTVSGNISNPASGLAGRVIFNDGIRQDGAQANTFSGKITAENALEVADGGLNVTGPTVLNGSLKLSYFATTSIANLEANFATYSVISYTGTGIGANITSFAAGVNGQMVYIVNDKTSGDFTITGGGILTNKAAGVFIYTQGNGWKQLKN